MTEEILDLKRLCDLAGVSARTIHYYIQRGLLPPSGTHGPNARYGRRHVDRLRLIARLKSEFLPLNEISKRLKVLSDEEVEEALGEAGAGEPSLSGKGSALDYVRQVLSKGEARRSAQPDMLEQLRSAAAQMRPPVGWDRSQWDRIALTPDVELHVRRPLTREGNKQLERLLEEARRKIAVNDIIDKADANSGIARDNFRGMKAYVLTPECSLWRGITELLV